MIPVYVFCKRCAATVTLLNAAFADKTYHREKSFETFAFCEPADAVLRIAKIQVRISFCGVPYIFLVMPAIVGAEAYDPKFFDGDTNRYAACIIEPH